MQFNHDELMLMMLYNTGTRQGLVREAEIAAFTPEKFYTVALAFTSGGTASSRRFSQKADEAVPANRAGLLSAYAAEAGCRPCAPICIHALSGKAEHCSVY